MSQGVYCIVNKKNGKRYVGSSRNIRSRVGAHFSALRSGRGFRDIQRDFDKYGEVNFTCEILEIVKDGTQLRHREEHWILKLRTIECGYNHRFAIPKGRNDVTSVINDEAYKALLDSKERDQVTISEWVRQAINERLEREGHLK